MDFGLDEEVEAFRAEVRAFVDGQMTDELEERLYRTGEVHDPDFTHDVCERGWLAAWWPEAAGGEPLDPRKLMAVKEEFQRRDAPTYSMGTSVMGAKAIAAAGNEELAREILPKVRSGDVVIVLGFSEPEAGSDVANAQLRAVRDGDEWVLNGSKMFTTNAQVADYVFLLTRTNPDVAKHKGLTTFLVPMDRPGIEVQAVYTLSGERTNITYYTDVRIEDRWRIGDVDGGWRVMVGSLQDEHSVGFGARLTRLLEEAETWARDETGADGRGRLDDPDVRERLARCATDAEVSLLLQRRAAWMAREGMLPEAEGPMTKLFSSEALERNAQSLCEMVGPDALRSYFDPTAPRGGRIEYVQRFALGTTIYAGTSEVQRNIIAQRGLGLPR